MAAQIIPFPKYSVAPKHRHQELEQSTIILFPLKPAQMRDRQELERLFEAIQSSHSTRPRKKRPSKSEDMDLARRFQAELRRSRFETPEQTLARCELALVKTLGLRDAARLMNRVDRAVSKRRR